MAKANTYEIEKGEGFVSKATCAICGAPTGWKKMTYRLFYNPTFMNGDAEWLGDYCGLHRDEAYTRLGQLKQGAKLTEIEYTNSL